MGSVGETIAVSGALWVSYVNVDACPSDMGYTEQALYCYGKVYSLDPTNVNAMWDRAALAKEFGNLRIVSF
jgi:hypothetical protein